MDLSNLCKLTADEILKGSFGIEWESLRAYSDGKLSLTPHPEIFGDKLKNPLITTDFSESQIDIRCVFPFGRSGQCIPSG